MDKWTKTNYWKIKKSLITIIILFAIIIWFDDAFNSKHYIKGYDILINDFLSINSNKIELEKIKDIKKIKPEASLWFFTKNDNLLFFISEYLDEDTILYYNNTSDEEILSWFDTEIDILNRKIIEKDWFKFFTFNGRLIIESDLYYYSFWIIIQWNEAINIYITWKNQKTLKEDFLELINSLIIKNIKEEKQKKEFFDNLPNYIEWK